MAKRRLSVSIDTGPMRKIPAHSRKAANHYMERRIKKVVAEARQTVAVDEGTLRDSIDWERDGDDYVAFASAPHAIFVEEGTDPHPIEPVEARILAFEIDGEMVFTPHVDHPGTDAQPFLEPAFDKVNKKLAKELGDEIYNAIKRVSFSR